MSFNYASALRKNNDTNTISETNTIKHTACFNETTEEEENLPLTLTVEEFIKKYTPVLPNRNKHAVKQWYKKPIVDAHGILMKETDEPYTREDYLNDFCQKIMYIVNSNGFNIISPNKLKEELSMFIYKYSEY